MKMPVALMGRVKVELSVVNNRDRVAADLGVIPESAIRRVTPTGVVDTGATRPVLPGSAVEALGLEPVSAVTARYADRRGATVAVVDNVLVELLGRTSIFKALVEPDRTDALIGAIVMEDLDLLVDCTRETIYRRDPDMVISEIE